MDGEMTPCVTPHNSVTQLSITPKKLFPNFPTGVKGSHEGYLAYLARLSAAAIFCARIQYAVRGGGRGVGVLT